MAILSSKNTLRRLSPIEEALAIINQAFPFTLVCVLRIQAGPSPQALQCALRNLQLSNPLLRAWIREQKGAFWFEQDKEANPILLKTEPRKDENQWIESAGRELNDGFDQGKAPLLRVLYLISPTIGGESEIIISFHHSITDAISLLYLTDQLLTMACENETTDNSIPSTAPVNQDFTSDQALKLRSFINGPRLWFRLLPFIYNQVRGEFRYRKSTRKVKDSAIPSSSENDLLTFSLSVEETQALVKWSRNKKLSLNGIITAAMMMVVNDHVYNGTKELMRAVQFANLRPYLKPPVETADGGSFIALMRFTVPLSPETDIMRLATTLDREYLKSARKGDKFLYALLSKMLVKKTIREHNSRLGAAALSYGGPIKFKTQYGNTMVTNIHGFITNNCLGSELSGFGKICFGRLSLDINFMPAEISREKATKMAEEIKLTLVGLVD